MKKKTKDHVGVTIVSSSGSHSRPHIRVSITYSDFIRKVVNNLLRERAGARF